MFILITITAQVLSVIGHFHCFVSLLHNLNCVNLNKPSGKSFDVLLLCTQIYNFTCSVISHARM